MSGIISGLSKRKIASICGRDYCGLPGTGHPGSSIAPLSTRKRIVSKEQLIQENNSRHQNRFSTAEAKRKKSN